MNSILVVVTFLAGASWGPTVTMTPISSAKDCGALRWEVAKQMLITAKPNVQSGASIIKNDDNLIVVAGAQGTREMARLSCKTA